MKFAILYLAAIFLSVLMTKADNGNSLQNPETYSDEEGLLGNEQKKIVRNPGEIAVMKSFVGMANIVVSFMTRNKAAAMPNKTESLIFEFPSGRLATIINFRNGSLLGFSSINFGKDIVLHNNKSSYTIAVPVTFTDLEITYDYKVTMGLYKLLGRATSTVPKTSANIVATMYENSSFINKIGNVLLKGERPVHMINTQFTGPRNRVWYAIKKHITKYTGNYLKSIIPSLLADGLKSAVEKFFQVKWSQL